MAFAECYVQELIYYGTREVHEKFNDEIKLR